MQIIQNDYTTTLFVSVNIIQLEVDFSFREAKVPTVELDCAQTVQTSAKAKISIKSDLGFGSGCLLDYSQNVVGVSHFAQCCGDRPVTV